MADKVDDNLAPDEFWDDGDWDDLDDEDVYCDECGMDLYEDCICGEICDECGMDFDACECDGSLADE